MGAARHAGKGQMMYYALDENNDPYPVPMMTWAKGLEKKGGGPWRVGLTKVGDAEVSTVFLGLDHNHGPAGPPILFETLVFGGPLSDEMERYATWTEAEAGHAKMVKAVEEKTK